MLAVLMSSSVMAGERVILKDQKTFEVEVNQTTVRCSARGYGLEELKINIKDLDGWTLFDHSNILFGDFIGLPCMTAGLCSFSGGEDGLNVDDVVQNNPRTETIVVSREVIESRHVKNDGNDKICSRSLMEKLHTTVGGVKFDHQRGSTLEKLPLAACTF